jgi:hypothetical protein
LVRSPLASLVHPLAKFDYLKSCDFADFDCCGDLTTARQAAVASTAGSLTNLLKSETHVMQNVMFLHVRIHVV